MLCQRHSTTFSIVLTRMTMIGKVRNMNHSDARKDFFISLRVIIGAIDGALSDRRFGPV